MNISTKSPVVAYKITLVNNANLHQDEVNGVRQFIYASKRISRATRKARIMSSNTPNIMLFAQYKNGQHSPITFRRVKESTF